MKHPIKPPKTGPSAATVLILVLLLLMVAAYVLYQVVDNLYSPYQTVAAYAYEADEETAVSGYVVREESVLPSQESGILEITRSEGERVGAGQAVATVYADDSALANEEELASLRTQREQLSYALESSSSSSAGVKLDNNIHAGIISMREDLYNGQYTSLESDISSLKSLVIQRSYSASGASTEELQTQLDDVNSRISALEAQQQRSAQSVTAPSSGLFSAVVDGYESTLTPAALETMTPSQLSAVSADSSLSSNVGKMIYGDTWYYAASMSDEDASAYRVGRSVTLRFTTELNRDLTMTVARISDSENGRRLVVFSCDEYLSEVTLLRRQSASIIHESYSGIRVPTAALRVEDGTPGVYCLVGMQAAFKPVTVVYQGENYYLVEPAKNADDTENTGTSRLRKGDSVIITAEELYDGKVISQ